jgi:23S rRNA (uridine2552-2'-O)-methyltransferase
MKANYAKPDYWSQRAASEGYPARSVYKLQEIDKKWDLLNGKKRVLDLGAAPGSWSLYALRTMGTGGFVCACDLQPLSRACDGGLFDDDTRFCFVRGDFLAADTQSLLAESGPYDLIISDAAPATTGNRTIDSARSLALCEGALAVSEALLSAGGVFVVKMFQGGDSAAFRARANAVFAEVKTVKPTACRSTSFEMYIVARGKRGCGG